MHFIPQSIYTNPLIATVGFTQTDAYQFNQPIETIIDDVEAISNNNRSIIEPEKTNTGTKAQSAPFRSCAEMEKDFGTKFTGTAKPHPFLLCRKPTNERLASTPVARRPLRMLCV